MSMPNKDNAASFPGFSILDRWLFDRSEWKASLPLITDLVDVISHEHFNDSDKIARWFDDPTVRISVPGATLTQLSMTLQVVVQGELFPIKPSPPDGRWGDLVRRIPRGCFVAMMAYLLHQCAVVDDCYSESGLLDMFAIDGTLLVMNCGDQRMAIAYAMLLVYCASENKHADLSKGLCDRLAAVLVLGQSDLGCKTELVGKAIADIQNWLRTEECDLAYRDMIELVDQKCGVLRRIAEANPRETSS